jgi:hypothetical protein
MTTFKRNFPDARDQLCNDNFKFILPNNIVIFEMLQFC